MPASHLNNLMEWSLTSGKLQPTSLNLHASKCMPQSAKQHVSLSMQPCLSMQSNVAPSLRTSPVTPTQHVVISTSLPPHLGSQPKPTVSQGSQCLQCQNQTADLYNLLQQQNDRTSLLLQMQTSQLLLRRKIPTYDGDTLQFNTFIKAFEH